VSATDDGYDGLGYSGRQEPRGPSAGGLDLLAGERRTDLVIRLWKTSSISGVVRDERGDPVVKATVHVLRRQYVRGRPSLSGSPVTTDDRGVFRRAGLSAGEYVVAVGRLSSARESPEYGTVYFGGARAFAEATILRLASGEERVGIDIVASPAPRRVPLSGRLIGLDEGGLNADGLPSPVVRLIPAGVPALYAELEEIITTADRQGRFAFSGVPPGDYRLLASWMPAALENVRIVGNLEWQGRTGPAPGWPASAPPS
jgi:hypothetical protein